MNFQKRNLLKRQAAVARRVVREIRPLYCFPRLYDKHERKMLNARYAVANTTAAKAAQHALGLSEAHQARLMRAMASEYPAIPHSTACGPLGLTGWYHTEKLVVISAMHRKWYLANNRLHTRATRQVLDFFHPPKKT